MTATANSKGITIQVLRGHVMKFCERCEAVHCKADSRAMGRFDPRGPRGYQPAYAGAPVLPTRDEAELDMCRHRAALRSLDRGSQR